MLPPDAPQLPSQLAALRDPGGIWSPHGLRSLSRGSSLYNAFNTEHDGPYWRGPIWVNLNFLALAALQHYAQVSPACMKFQDAGSEHACIAGLCPGSVLSKLSRRS